MKIKHFSNLSVCMVCLTNALFFFFMTAYIALANDYFVKIGVLAKRGPVQCLSKWTPTAEYLSNSIPGRHFVIAPLGFDKINSAVEKGEVDFVLANPSIYVELEYLYGANRIATLKNRRLGGTYTKFGGVIFCRANRNDIRNLIDLKRKTFMAVSETSFGGWQMAWRELKEKGIDPYRDFKALKFGGTHDAVVDAVRDGKIDAGTVRTDTLERMQHEGKINIQNFHVFHEHGGEEVHLPFLHSTRSYPEWPMAKVKHTSDELAKQVAIALLNMPGNSPAAKDAKCDGWTIPMNYQSVHECLKYLKVGPYKDLYKITLKDVVKKYWYIFVISFAVFFIMAGFIFKILCLNRTIKTNQIKLEAEIKERYHVEEKLIDAKKAAESASRTKSAFLANMSHEIRTPMNGIIAAIDLALNKELPPNVRHHYLMIIQSSAYSLLEIINDILDFSKIEADKLDLEIRPFLLDDVIDRVTDIFHNRLAEKSIELLLDIDQNTPKNLIGDSLRLQQIIRNLVDNSIKFSPKGGVVIVGIKPTETLQDSVTLSFFVKDNGIGIAQEHIPDLFRRFSQVDMSTKRKYTGTGLGLSICKSLVEMMGGKIWVQSELDKGSTFFFTVRFRRLAKEMPRKLVPPPEIQDIKALVVDDCPESRTIIQKMLKSFGLPVESVSSGTEALRVLEEKRTSEDPFKLVIIDWMMPGMDGIEVSKRIREDLNLTVPIVMMTAFGRGVEKLISKQEGINAFLNKPIAQSSLLNVIMDVFGKEVYGKEKIKHITTKASIYKKRLKGIRILVAEDNLTSQEIAKAILEGAGIIVDVANNGEEAVEAVKKQHFDAVLMDVQMPKMDGYEATQAIRKDPKVKSIPIIAMTAYAMKGDEEMCLSVGMDGYISKPIRQDRLFMTLCKAIKHPRKAATRHQRD